MTPKRSPRSLAAVWLALALALAAMAGPAMTLADTPNWTGSLEALPPVIGEGGGAGYRATINNPGPSNVSQLFVSATFSQPYLADTAFAGSDAPFFVKLFNDGEELEDACGDDPPTGPVTCTVGALRAGTTAVLVVAYATEGYDDAGVTVRWTTTGLGSGPGDASHGDVLMQIFDTSSTTPLIPPPTDISDNPSFDGGFTGADGEAFSTSGAFSALNLFTTNFTTEDDFIPVMVQDDTTAAFAACPDGENCYGAPSQDAILLSINEGVEFDELTPFTIKVHKDAVPKGSNVNRVVVVHYFDDGSSESISNACPTNTAPTGTCRTVSWTGKTGIWTILVYLEENGVIKFH